MLYHLTLLANSHHSDNSDTFYKHQHGNELQMMDVFNETFLQGEVVDMGDYEDLSFNTLDQFHNLMQKKSLR